MKRPDFNIELFPNGETNFPDIRINGIDFDFKAVKCSILKNGEIGAPNYKNAIHGCYGVISEFKDLFDNNIHSPLIKSFIIYTYYTVNDNGYLSFVDFDIIPTICTIKTGEHGFTPKYVSEYGIQNANVCIGYSGINATETYLECLNRLKEVTKIQ
jgi:hypothetical protein